jgi:RNA polymerase sigma factor (sigma-70 family)
MLTEQEAQDLMNKFVDLKEKIKISEDPKLKKELKQHEKICMSNFKYLVTMKTGRYKSFSNYDDLNQEGFEALIKAMNNYNAKKGSFFWWAHKYIDTRISRSANLHTTIRIPLKVAKLQTPHKEAILPTLIEERYCPDKQLEDYQTNTSIQNALSLLTNEQRNVIDLVYGFSSDEKMSINKVCQKLSISRSNCLKLINSSLALMKDSIKI